VRHGGERRRLVFEWREFDGPPVAPPRRQGFGSRLLQRVLTTQLQAEVDVRFEPGGLAFRMEAPMPDKPSGPDLTLPGRRRGDQGADGSRDEA
jgi:two-component sensor histidine kinase